MQGGSRIQISDLSKHYGPVQAAEAVELDIRQGEFVTFLGPSGSGKTTTLMMVAGFTVPTRGDILIDGRSVVPVPVHKRNIGMVFQNYALFPHMSVADNIAFPLQMRGIGKSEIRERVAKALDLVRLGQHGDRRPKQLSGGQQQRIALARALVFEPSILLLDEPLGALDAKLREEMKFELKQLHHRIGATILFVTHDQEEALTLSDRIAVFNDGRIMQTGRPDELYRAPANRFVADFIGETNLLSGRVTNCGGEVITIDAGGQSFSGRMRSGFSQPRSEATFTLRLESLRILRGGEPADCRADGVIEEFLYVGNSTKYLVRLASGQRLTARIPGNLPDETLRVNSKVTLGWNHRRHAARRGGLSPFPFYPPENLRKPTGDYHDTQQTRIFARNRRGLWRPGAGTGHGPGRGAKP